MADKKNSGGEFYSKNKKTENTMEEAKEEIIIHDNSFPILKKAQNSAIEVAKYLLSLDPKNASGLRKYFTLRLISFGEEPDSSQTREGNFRLNKILHMCQIFHCIEYGKPLFKERMEAYENGAIVYKVRLDFMKLWNLPSSDLVTNISKEVQDFVCLVYNYFHSNYEDDNKALREFSHQDPAWHEGLEREGGIMPLNDRLITYYKKFFYDTLDEIKEYDA